VLTCWRAQEGSDVARVLIIDDHPLMGTAVSELVRCEGHESVYFPGGVDALAYLRSLLEVRDRRPDLVLLDVQMPDLNGLEVLRQIRATAGLRGMPVIMMTSFPEKRVREEAVRLGAADVWDKESLDDGRIGRSLNGSGLLGSAHVPPPPAGAGAAPSAGA
jgi:CheY-like chemotaxis protein